MAIYWSDCAGPRFDRPESEALATRAVRRGLPWFGFEISSNSLTWAAIKLVLIIGLLALLRLL